MDIEEGGYQDWAVDVEPGDANSYPTEDAIEHAYVVVTATASMNVLIHLTTPIIGNVNGRGKYPFQ